jgi:hypoxanthine phosphoribosyltransferase
MIFCILSMASVTRLDFSGSGSPINSPNGLELCCPAEAGSVRIIMDLERDIRSKDVLLVEDIIDSGRTLHYICEVLRAREPASLKICMLLDKYERREVEVPLDYVGFHIPNKFVFGYGLDPDELYRNLPFIGVVRD